MCDVTSVLDIDTETLTARRLDFVLTLEGGTYEQCTGELFQHPLVSDGNEVSPASYCCIGVGCDVMNPGHFLSGDVSDLNNYARFRRHYGVSMSESKHLVALNDMRNRDFPFIARFLRKVWGLTGA